MSGPARVVAAVLEHEAVAERTFRVRLNAPELAAAARPGQFFMLRVPGRTDPLLGRPFALYDVSPDGTAFDVVYLVVGKMTRVLATVRVGESLEVVGPLGNAFPEHASAADVTLVAGGIGQTPFLAYTRALKRADAARPVTLLYGVRTAALAAGVADFRNAGATVEMATDDGSLGHRGYVTDLLSAQASRGPVVACGPEPMLQAVARVAESQGRVCHVSLETPMACGVGICFSCVARVRLPEGGWDYKRVCVDGPTFEASGLEWGG